MSLTRIMTAACLAAVLAPAQEAREVEVIVEREVKAKEQAEQRVHQLRTRLAEVLDMLGDGDMSEADRKSATKKLQEMVVRLKKEAKADAIYDVHYVDEHGKPAGRKVVAVVDPRESVRLRFAGDAGGQGQKGKRGKHDKEIQKLRKMVAELKLQADDLAKSREHLKRHFDVAVQRQEVAEGEERGRRLRERARELRGRLVEQETANENVRRAFPKAQQDYLEAKREYFKLRETRDALRWHAGDQGKDKAKAKKKDKAKAKRKGGGIFVMEDAEDIRVLKGKLAEQHKALGKYPAKDGPVLWRTAKGDVAKGHGGHFVITEGEDLAELHRHIAEAHGEHGEHGEHEEHRVLLRALEKAHEAHGRAGEAKKDMPSVFFFDKNGKGGAGGLVLDAKGKPVEGAKVRWSFGLADGGDGESIAIVEDCEEEVCEECEDEEICEDCEEEEVCEECEDAEEGNAHHAELRNMIEELRAEMREMRAMMREIRDRVRANRQAPQARGEWRRVERARNPAPRRRRDR